MYNFYLSSKEKAELELRHKQSRDVKEIDRIKAILLRSEGWTIPMIAQALRIHEIASSLVSKINNNFQKLDCAFLSLWGII